MNKFKFEELWVYQEAILFADSLYTLTEKWPRDELFGLTNQLRRAAVSIALNIAEGSSRTKKDFRHFLDLARGSCYECVAVLMIATKRQYITDKQHAATYEQTNKLARMINALKASLQ